MDEEWNKDLNEICDKWGHGIDIEFVAYLKKKLIERGYCKSNSANTKEYQCSWCGNGRTKDPKGKHGLIHQQERCDKARKEFYESKSPAGMVLDDSKTGPCDLSDMAEHLYSKFYIPSQCNHIFTSIGNGMCKCERCGISGVLAQAPLRLPEPRDTDSLRTGSLKKALHQGWNACLEAVRKMNS